MKKAFSFSLICILLSFILIMFIDIPKINALETNKKVTILFTHDMHDNFLPVKDGQGSAISELGGYARLQNGIFAEKKKNPEALLLDAGDFSMGTPFQTIFKSDSPGLRIMGELGYDVVTLGNHEYDYRASGLADSLNAARKSGDKLPRIVQSNVTFPTDQNNKLTPSLISLKQAYEDYGVQDYVVIERDGIKVGVFGLMGADAASKAPMSEVKFTDTIESAQRVVKILKDQEKVDLIISLSHSGLWIDHSKSEDEILAQKVPEIDVIISGHTHTKSPEPIIVGKTIIGSAEDSGKYLGVIEISRGTNLEWKLEDYRLLQIEDEIGSDSNILEIINDYKELVEEKYFERFDLSFDQVLAVSPFNFDTVDKMYENHYEAPLGNLISDAYIYAVKKAEGVNYIPIDVAIVPIGTIRSSFFQGNITVADAFSVSSLGIGPDNIPGYPLLSVYLTGKELKTVCEVDASVSPLMDDAQLFISGMSFTFNPNRLIFNKVTNTSLQRPDGSLEEIDDQKLYRVVAGLYSAQMLSVVGDKSFGLLSIIPKTKEGNPITDFEAQVVKDAAAGNNNEVKEWLALAEYLQSFDKVNEISRIPQYYNEYQGRKIVDNNDDISAFLSTPNRIALTVYTIVIVIVALLIFILFKIATRKKRIKRVRYKQPNSLS
ncbi:MAG: bifunctional metallophosphatase/5'-nucleotidase [Gracilibacter sp. BRH_c7a]|nr:MAG: bifunctional metallophosphatase/5'-nucleotidase [Gracilibacter sp. BRH_c7a]